MTHPIVTKTFLAFKGSVKLFKFFVGFAATIIIASTVFFAGIYIFFARDLPDIKTLRDYSPPVISEVFANDGTKVGEFWSECRIFIPFDDMPKKVIQAFVDSEDSRFFEHKGVDVRSIIRAFVTNMRAGGVKQGGSTITQQVTRALLLTREKSLERKAKEAILATRIERYLTKKEILTLYLNQIYLGNRSYGIAAAARNYFKKNLGELTLGQITLIAGLPTAPSEFSPVNSVTEARKRQEHVLGRMIEEGHVTETETRDALAEQFTIYVAGVDKDFADKDAAWFTEHVRRRVKERYGDDAIYKAGLKIYTTLDLPMQRAAENAIRRGIERIDRQLGYRGIVEHINPNQISEKSIEIEKELLFKQGLEISWPPGRQVETKSIQFTPYEMYKSIVTDFGGKDTYIQIGNVSGIIKYDNLKWAHPWHPGVIGYEGGSYVNDPKSLLKIGDVIWARFLEDGTFQLAQEPMVQSALLSMDTHNKYIKAMVGGYDFAKSEFNRANQALRQPGSSFKAFVYSSGLDKGYTEDTTVVDGPVSFTVGNEIWTPKNYGGNYNGAMPYKSCIVQSRNIPTAKIVYDIGTHYLTAFERKLGMTSPIGKYLSMALGANSVYLQEMVQAYSVFADQGRFKPAVAITKIENSKGQVIEAITEDSKEDLERQAAGIAAKYEGEKVGKALSISELNPLLWEEGQRAIETDKLNLTDLEIKTLYGNNIPLGSAITPQTAYIMIDMLKSVVENGTGTRLKPLGRPAAGKTGTTNDETDAWFIGMVPDLAAGVWIGFDEVQKIGQRVTGGVYAAPIVLDYMKVATAELPPRDFDKPEDFPSGNIAGLTGGSAIFGSQPKKVVFPGEIKSSGDRAGQFFEEDFENFR